MSKETIVVEGPSGARILIEATVSGEEQVSFSLPKFSGLTDAVKDISTAIMQAIETVKPTSAEIEFGIDAAVEAGNLTALLVKGSGTANLKIKLTWETK